MSKKDPVLKPAINTQTAPIKKSSPETVAKPESKPEPKPTPTVKVEPKTKPVKPIEKQDLLFRQNPTHFTLQLMGSHKRDSLTLIQRAHKLTTQSAIIRTQLKGADWYILIYKSFPDKQQARNAAKTLPKALRLTQPWPRRLGELKNLK